LGRSARIAQLALDPLEFAVNSAESAGHLTVPSEYPIEPLLHPRLKCEQVFMHGAYVARISEAKSGTLGHHERVSLSRHGRVSPGHPYL
jgi:hypothetical protein